MHYLCKRLLGEIALPLAQIPRISSRNVTIFSSLSRLLSPILSFILPAFPFPALYHVPLLFSINFNVYEISILRQKFISSGNCWWDCYTPWNDVITLQFFFFFRARMVVIFTDIKQISNKSILKFFFVTEQRVSLLER